MQLTVKHLVILNILRVEYCGEKANEKEEGEV